MGGDTVSIPTRETNRRDIPGIPHPVIHSVLPYGPSTSVPSKTCSFSLLPVYHPILHPSLRRIQGLVTNFPWGLCGTQRVVTFGYSRACK